MKKFKLLFIIILLPIFYFSQNIGVGVSTMYNFQTESFGFGGRVNLFPNKTISYAPQISYYPGFGKISEYLIGLAIEYKVRRGNKLNYYVLLHGAYNQWLNAGSSGMEGAQAVNWDLEGGVGISGNRCLRPFIEYRYNIKFQETHLRIGLLYIFGCRGGNKSMSGYRDPQRMKRGSLCPAY